MSESDNWPPTGVEPPVAHPEAPPAGTKLSPHYGQCFGCGDDVEAGLHIESMVDAQDPAIVVSQFPVTRAHQGAPGLAHGGLLACAFDEALGSTVGNLLRRPAVTGKLETDFRHPVPIGSTLYIVARIDGTAGRKIYVSADGRLDAEDGPVAVQARALFITVDVEHFINHGDAEQLRELSTERMGWDINP